MTKEDLLSCGLPAAHSFTLFRVIEKFKNISVSASIQVQKFPGSAGQASQSRPALAEIMTNENPSNSNEVRKRRMDPPDDGSPTRKRATATIDKCDKVLFSNLHPQKGFKAYVRIPIKRSLQSRPDLIEAMKSGVLLPIPKREAMDILITAMYNQIQSWYPHTDAKVKLAQYIVSVFPKLASCTGDRWSAFFDRGTGTGHIQTALNGKRVQNQVRVRNPASTTAASAEKPGTSSASTEKPATSSTSLEEAATSSASKTGPNANVPTTVTVSDQDEIEIVNLALRTDTPENRLSIITNMHKFYPVRQDMLRNNIPTEEIIARFPKLFSYEGALIDADFSALKGTVGDNFLGTYTLIYQPSILKYLQTYNNNILLKLSSYKEDALKSLLSLVALLPKYPWQSRKVNAKNPVPAKGPIVYEANTKVDRMVTFPHPALMQVIGTNTEVSRYKSTFYRTRPDGSVMVQPYLLFVSDDCTNGTFYLKANYRTMFLGPSPLRAMEVLVKYHHIFDLEYDTDLAHFYDFLEFVFGLKKKLVAKMSQLVTSLQQIQS